MRTKLNQASVVVIIAALLLILSAAIIPAQAAASYGEGLLQRGSTGQDVAVLQEDLTLLGYDTYGADGIFGQNTYNAVLKFQKDRGLNADGIVGSKTKTALNNSFVTASVKYRVKWGDSLSSIARQHRTTVRELMNLNKLSSSFIYAGSTLLVPQKQPLPKPKPPVPPAPEPSQKYGEMADWWTVASQVFAVGDVAVITDLDSGLTYRVMRKGGSKHADCQPLTAQDTANMLQAYGGQWAWTRHAILVSIDGRVFAASQNGMPHGSSSIYDNNFPGHFCIHFLNSRTHGTDNLDPAHQAMVHKAAGQAY